ncbi:hypothetical protein DV737_g2868, partial [Chaetothyriales sp. CBS 132003]
MAPQAGPRSRPSLGDSRHSRHTSTHSDVSDIFSDEHAYSDGEISPDEASPHSPYGLYPQATRASSIASESTIRPAELPFVAQGGPEHPYAMYQNTVPEEVDDNSDDENEGSQHLRAVPLGFSSGSAAFRNQSTSSGNDTGDIVGSDGHVEQLPPYSRFADNVIAKGDMASIDAPSTTLVDSSASQSEHTVLTRDDSASRPEMEMNAVAREPMEEEDEQVVARKEGWFAKSKRRKCCGLPLLTVIIIGFAIFAAAALGGIIGGVIGNRNGTESAIGSTAATTTVWLDADPASTGPGTPTCPTGHYTIPVTNTIKLGSCVVDQDELADTWDCMNQSSLGISVFGHGPYQVAFDDYSVLPKLFEYGPQPPDFNGTSFNLSPAQDKDDSQLGVAMFFSHLFDKLIILESDALDAVTSSDKRSVRAGEIRRRGQNVRRGTYLSVADKPWYCFWNSTIEEFWIFLDQNIDQSSASDSSSQSSFPKLIKMVEKRKPVGNVAPYCQQMQVLSNWQIVPITSVPTIAIQESDFAQPTGSRRRWSLAHRLKLREPVYQDESSAMTGRRKALLIGINYYGSSHQLQGCESDVNNMVAWLISRGYSTHPRDMVVMTQSRGPGPYYPVGANIIAAMDWLVSEPECALFLHYSGHGGQIADPTGERRSGMESTIVPVDFEAHGQISSDILHRHLVSALPQNCTLFVIFDCCHSGSTLELPWVYKPDADGNIGLMDNVQAGIALAQEASSLIQGGFSFQKIDAAKHLIAGATDFFQSLKNQFSGGDGDGDGDDNNNRASGSGLQIQDDFGDDWSREERSVFMFSGCKDDQTSADAFIQGKHVGAMSDAFLRVMKTDVDWNYSYVRILQGTREILQQNYSQVPQLSCGYQFDLNRPMRV